MLVVKSKYAVSYRIYGAVTTTTHIGITGYHRVSFTKNSLL